MSKIVIRKHIVLTWFLMLFWVFAISQTKSDLIRLGNTAFDKGNYASAAYFYNKVITGGNSGIIEVVHPYDLKHSNRVKKEKKAKDNKEEDVTGDTLNTDTALVAVPVASVQKDSTDGGTIVRLESEDVDMNYIINKLAESYRLDYNYIKAEEWYFKSMDKKVPEYPLVGYWFANSLMQNEKYEEALEAFSGFITKYPADGPQSEYRDMAKTKMKSCNYALEHGGDVKGVALEICDSTLNSGTASFAAGYFGSEAVIIYSMSGVSSDNKTEDVKENFDLYITSTDGNKWDLPDKIPAPISTGKHEATVSVNANSTRIYFTRWDGNNCAIYASNNFQGNWLEPFKLNEKVNLEGYKSTHPHLDEENNTLYFTSDRPGGKGGMDIWMCQLDRFGNPEDPVNVGAGINTEKDEASAFLSSLGDKLYFSSDGHVGFGGKDIHYSMNYEGEWLKAKNMGKPINSSRDDIYFITSSDGKSGFLSSDRMSCEDCAHGNCMRLYNFKKGPPQFFLDGIAFNADTDEEIANAKITIKDVKKDSVLMTITTDETGYYSTNIGVNMIYFIKGQKYKFFGDATSVSTMGLTESQSFMRDLYLTPIPDEEVEIPGIEYDYDKATLRPESREILDDLYDFLELNDNLVVEIQSHTDDRGNNDYNLKLSQERAKSCVDYLVNKGIDINRLIPIGYGENRLKIKNAKTEDEHQKNRRTAFNVVSQNFGE